MATTSTLPSPHLLSLRKTPKTPKTPFLPRPNNKRHSGLSCRLSNQTDAPTTLTSSPPPPHDLRVAFACGGTGGHIYPAIAIADELRAALPHSHSLFLGSAQGLEATVVPAAGYAFSPVPSSPLSPLLPLTLPRSLAAATLALRRFRPHVVVGTGGHISLPTCLAAALLGVKIVIQEQNASPGLANRALAPFAEHIFLAFNGCVRHLPKKKCMVYGNPVRMSLRKYTSKAVARAHFFPRAVREGETAEVVLVLGGSGGAAEINVAMLNMYYEMLKERKNRYIIWQTGADGFCEMESLVKSNRRLLLTPFLHAMDMAYAAADIIVSRAGAMTCTEILVTGKPSILIPLPTVADDHQIKNAYIMADVMGAKVLTEDELDSSSLASAIDEVFGDEKLMADMSQKALSAARPNSSADIVRHICSLVGISSPT